MSTTVSSLTSNHSIPLQQLVNNSTNRLVLYFNPSNNSEQNISSTILIQPPCSNSFHNDLKSSHNSTQEFIHRLSHQKSRLERLYDIEIERRQSNSQLMLLLDKIDQLLDEYEKQMSILSNFTDKRLPLSVFESFLYLDNATNIPKQYDDQSNAVYFNSKDASSMFINLFKNLLHKMKKKNGYIILISDESSHSNSHNAGDNVLLDEQSETQTKTIVHGTDTESMTDQQNSRTE